MERITRDFYRNRTEKTKRWLGLLTFCMMLGSMQTSAQIWTIDDCTPGSPLGSAAYGPMYSTTNANATNRTAMFYPASQLTGIAGQELTGIYFNKITSNDMTGSPYLKIYLKETTDTDFGTGALAWDDAILGATLVYEDNPATAVAGSSGWKELSFSSNYTYSGTNNLVLITEYVNGGNTVNTTWWYEYTNSCIDTSNNDTTKYVNNTTGVPGESLSSSNYRRPIIGFDFTVDCPAPTDVLLSDITTTGITINWTAGGTETDWDYAFQPIGSGVPTSFSQTTSATLTVSDLSPSTGYEFYVRADCGGSDGESVWKGPYEFYTACGVATSEFYEGFETTPPGGSTNPTVPQCWSFIDTGSGYGYTSSTTPQEGVRNFYMYNGPASDTGHYILVSPETDNLGSGTMRVKFWARTTSTVVSPLTYIDFGTLSSNTDETTFTVVESIPLTNVYTEYTVIIPATTDDYFGFRHDLVTKARYIYIDSITYEDIPSCLEPSDLTASNILTDSVDLYWVSDGNLFDIEYGEAGFTQGTGTIISDITSSPYTLTGLNAMTTYEVYIRRDCGGGDESPWVSAPISFMTACGSAPTLDENFDDYGTGSIVPECWVRLTAATGTGSQTISSTTPASGTRNIYQYASSTQNPVIVVLPEFSNIDAGTHWLRFKARVSSGAPGALQVGYVTDATDYDSFVLLETLTINNTSYTADDAEYIISVPTTVPSAARLAIKNSADGKSYYWDDVIWEGAPSCLPPLGLSYAQLSMTSAELSWTSTGSLFDIEWGAQGFTQGSGTMVTDYTTTSYQLTGLTTDAVYEFYVRQDCGATDGESTWTGPYSFSVGYCSSVPTSNDNNGITNVSLGSASFPVTDVTYYNYTGSIIDIAAGTTVASSVTFETGYSYHTNIWIDLNDDGVFDSSSELVFQGESEQTGFTAGNPTTLDTSFFLDALANLGQHKMRIGTADSGQLTPNPCYSGSYGVTVDLMVNVTAPPSCIAPSGLSHTQLSTTSAELSWTSTGSLFDIEWGAQGFTQGSGTLVTDLTTTSYQLTGLTTDAVYEFYVLQDCGATDGESTWTGPYSFSVGYCSSVPTSNDNNGITNVSLGSASFPVTDVTY
ncbi:MAG: fibronectin type III domain-containing protein, partial [Flavobacteriaceae bacterium]